MACGRGVALRLCLSSYKEGVEVGDRVYFDVRAQVVVLPDVGALALCVHVIEEGGVARSARSYDSSKRHFVLVGRIGWLGWIAL